MNGAGNRRWALGNPALTFLARATLDRLLVVPLDVAARTAGALRGFFFVGRGQIVGRGVHLRVGFLGCARGAARAGPLRLFVRQDPVLS